MFRRGVWVGLLITIAFAGCAEEGFQLDSGLPAWESGYSFSTRESYDYDVYVSMNGAENRESGKLGPVMRASEVVNTTSRSDTGEPVYLVAVQTTAPPQMMAAVDAGDAQAPSPLAVFALDQALIAGGSANARVSLPVTAGVGLEAFRQSDLAPMDVAMHAEKTCVGSPSSQACKVRSLDVNVSAPEGADTFLPFPLKRGESWTMGSESAKDPETGITMRSVVSAKVYGGVEITTPLGQLRVIRVDSTTRIENLDEALDTMRQSMTKSGVKVEKLEMTVSARTSYFYSPDYQAVVRTQSDVDVTMDIRASGQGQTMELKSTSKVRGGMELVGARMVARPERSMAEIGAILSGTVKVNDPKGSLVEPVDYSLKVAASEAHVNAAETPTVSFKGEVVGAAALPEGTAARWRILDAATTVVASGDGLSFERAFDQPGVYTIEVEAVRGNATTAAASTQLVADWKKTLTMDCSMVTVRPITGSCDGLELPVQPGIKSLNVRATLEGPASDLSNGQLELRDPSGRGPTSGGPGPGPWSVAVKDFTLSQVDGTPWTLRFNANRAVSESVDVDVVLAYGAAEAAPVAKAAPLGGIHAWAVEMVLSGSEDA